jgi:alkylation response protein AidB-like acyl-CoA dehydrogenase
VSITPVRLRPDSDVAVDTDGLGDVESALQLAVRLGGADLMPGTGDTRHLFETLATIAAADLGAARAIEPHLDAIAILAQADQSDLVIEGTTWGVFAAEGGPPLAASRVGDDWRLAGTKPWCSLADRLTSALVTATLDDGSRRLFAVDLRNHGVTVQADSWHARGLVEIPSGPVRFEDVAATPVGDAGWYLDRPGFAWGGIAVAACWYGGTVALARDLYAAIAGRPKPGDIALAHLGAVDEQVESARRALDDAAAQIDSGSAEGTTGSLLAKRVRSTVVRAAEDTLTRIGHALGPAPLAQSAEHAKRVADLTLYIRQHHAEKDDASLGRALVVTGDAPW